MTHLYISGVISSDIPGTLMGGPFPLWKKKQLFVKADMWLTLRGFDVINPLDVEPCKNRDCNGFQSLGPGIDYQHTWQCYMRHDLLAILQDDLCKTIVMLPHSGYSRGARIEREMCHGIGFGVYRLDAAWDVGRDEWAPMGLVHIDGPETLK